MNLVLLIYLASIADSLSTFLCSIGYIGILIVPLLVLLANFAANDTGVGIPTAEKLRKHLKWFMPLCLVLWLVGIMIPNERTIYLMTAGYATEQVISNPRVQKISNDLLDVVEGKLEDMKKDEQGDKQ